MASICPTCLRSSRFCSGGFECELLYCLDLRQAMFDKKYQKGFVEYMSKESFLTLFKELKHINEVVGYLYG